MATVEERVVGMRFDSSKFNAGIKPALDGLDKLKESLNIKGATKALDDLDAAGKKFTLANISTQIEGVSTRFLTLATVGITALSNIANKAINAGETIIKSLTIDPVKAGLDEYELKMGSIQTILANTARYNTKLPEVVAALDELNTYADKTIYNFGAMTKNIGLFTNAGIGIQDATSMIKGFSNEAAASGTTSEGAAGAAYQLSQALSAGTIRLMDWRSLTNVGMGNKNMQNGIIEIAEAMGTFSNGTATAKSASKDFNHSLEENWLTADVMSTYLKIMAGDMDDATQASLGLSDAQIEAFKKQQKTAEEAATKVRTYTQLIGTMREAVGSGWAQSFDIIIGDFDEATELFTAANNTFSTIIGDISDARNKLLQDWSDNGGRAAAIDAIASAFHSVMAIIGKVQQAFVEVFPPITGKRLAELTKNFLAFVQGLRPSPKLLEDIKSTFKGFFAILSIGGQIIGGFVKMIWGLLGVLAPAGGSILGFTGNIGEFLVKVDEAIKKGGGLKKFFENLGAALAVPVQIVVKLASLLGQFFENLWKSEDGIEEYSKNMENRFQPLVKLGEFLSNLWTGLGAIFQKVAEFFGPLARQIADLVGSIGSQIGDAMKEMKFNTILDLINTGLLGGIVILFKKFTGSFGKMADSGLNLNFFGGLKEALGGLTGYLKALQDNVRADTIMKIAIAVALLAAAAIGLSLVDSVKLAAALGAITVMFGQLIGGLALLEKVMGLKGFFKMPFLTASLVLLAGAMLLLSVALVILSSMSWDEVARGLTALAGSMAIMAAASKFLSPTLILTGPGLAAAAVGIMLLAVALKVLSTLSWDDIGRSMAVLGSSLAILAVGLTLMAGTLIGSAALVIASVGLIALAVALKILSTLSWDDIGRSMVLLGGALAILAVGLTLMVASLPGAAALVVASVALIVLATAFKILATLSWEEIWKSLVLLGGALGILAVGLTLMIAALPGAAALVVAAAGLAVLAVVLKAMGSMPWDQIGTGLITMALALGIVIAAGYLLTPVVPTLFAFGGALLLIGLAALAAGLGIMALSIGLTGLGVAGAAGTAGLVALVSGLLGLIPMAAEQLGLGIVALAVTIGEAAPQLVVAIVALLTALIDAIIQLTPKLIELLGKLVEILVVVLVDSIPKLVEAGILMLLGILKGIADHIGEITEVGFDIVIAFIDAIAKKLPKIIDSAAKLVISFIDGIGEAVKKNSDKFVKAGSKLFRAIVDGVAKAIEQGGSDLRYAGEKIGNALLQGAKNALGIASPSKEFYKVGWQTITGVINAMTKGNKLVGKSGEDMGNSAVKGLQKSLEKIPDTINTDMLTPTIRPVLDLSLVKKDAGLIGGIVGGQSLSVDGATARANEIAAKYGEYQQAQADAQGPTTEVTMTQNNYSPKALPAVEVYRQTNNQISILKGELEKKDA